MKKILKLVSLIVLVPVLYVVVVLIVGTLSNYSPEPQEQLSSFDDVLLDNDSAVYSALTWNIGYAGLGAEMDFFYDGGKMGRDTKENVENNLVDIVRLLERNDSIDFILLQEVDQRSKRTYKMNQVDMLGGVLSSKYSFSCLNYNVNYVPIPLLKPMGKVKSGLLSLSSYIPTSTIRYAFPGSYSWPKSIFMLDRCFMVQRFSLPAGKELLVINTHNSAYDNGSMRKAEIEYLRNVLLEEEAKGNYIIVGGDWNQCPPNFKNKFTGHVFDAENLSFIPEGYPAEGWTFSYDCKTPTNRRVKASYEKGKTSVTLIDFYLSSPGIEVLHTKVLDLDFKSSDHQPVVIQFRLL